MAVYLSRYLLGGASRAGAPHAITEPPRMTIDGKKVARPTVGTAETGWLTVLKQGH